MSQVEQIAQEQLEYFRPTTEQSGEQMVAEKSHMRSALDVVNFIFKVIVFNK